MTQDINLYQSMLRPRRVPLPAAAMLRIAVVTLIVLTAGYGFAWWRLQPLEGRVASAFEEVGAAETRLIEVRQRFPARKATPAVTQTLTRRRAVLDHTRQIALKLRAGAYGSIDGLSPFLEGLARQHREGSWLTRVRVQAGGSAVGIAGRALLPELVPAYIARLAEEPAFRGKAFSELELEVIDDSFGEIGFTVLTRGVKREGGS